MLGFNIHSILVPAAPPIEAIPPAFPPTINLSRNIPDALKDAENRTVADAVSFDPLFRFKTVAAVPLPSRVALSLTSIVADLFAANTITV